MLIIIIIGCCDFRYLSSFSVITLTENPCALVTSREMETPGQIWCKDLVLIVMAYAWQDPDSFISRGMYVDLATQRQTFGTILGYEILLDAAQAAVFNIHFFSETFATLFRSIQT